MIADNIDILRKHVPTIGNNGIGFAELEEHVKAAESHIRNDLLGSALFDFIEAEKLNAAHGMLTGKVERIIALNAFDRAVPLLNLVLTAAGFGVTNNEKIAPASKERVADLREGLKKQCADAIEDLIIFLEAKPEYADKWKTSPSYSLHTDTFLPTFMLFKSYAPYSVAVDAIYPKCRLAFAGFRGKMRSVMTGKIAGAVGKKTVAALLTAMNTDSLSAVEKQLLEPLRFALAAYTLGQNEEGDSFINMALSIIKDNPDDFEDSGLNFGAPKWKDSAIINLC
jgi:hypothetical protein